MKGKFILITAILLSLLHQGFSQREDFETIIKMPAKYKKAFDEGQKLMSDLIESESLKNLQDKIVCELKQKLAREH
ncbi:MAG TPA: hypothetical protein VK892_15740 [Pyrinomonadaceae bacterium]|nr:hypothetical protein [Pyrinomonadaceae bacterium]